MFWQLCQLCDAVINVMLVAVTEVARMHGRRIFHHVHTELPAMAMLIQQAMLAHDGLGPGQHLCESWYAEHAHAGQYLHVDPGMCQYQL